MSTYINSPVRLVAGFRVTGTLIGQYSAAPGWVATPFSVPTGSYMVAGGLQYQSTLYDSLSDYVMIEALGGASAYLDNDTNRIELVYASDFSASFSSPLAEMLGFVSGVWYSGASSITAPNPPQYVWSSTEHGFGFRTGERQDRDVIEQRYADDGTPYTIKRARVWNTDNFGFSFEPTENVFNRYSGSANPFPWERMINHLQRGLPFLVYHTNDAYLESNNYDAAMIISKSGHAFEPEKEEPLMDDWWKVEMAALVIPEE